MNPLLAKLHEERAARVRGTSMRTEPVRAEPARMEPVRTEPMHYDYAERHQKEYLKRIQEEKDRLICEAMEAARKRDFIERQRSIMACLETSVGNISSSSFYELCELVSEIRSLLFDVEISYIEEYVGEKTKLWSLVSSLVESLTEKMLSVGSDYISILSDEGKIISEIKQILDDINQQLLILGMEAIDIQLMDTSLDDEIAKRIQSELDQELLIDDLDVARNINNTFNEDYAPAPVPVPEQENMNDDETDNLSDSSSFTPSPTYQYLSDYEDEEEENIENTT